MAHNTAVGVIQHNNKICQEHATPDWYSLVKIFYSRRWPQYLVLQWGFIY